MGGMVNIELLIRTYFKRNIKITDVCIFKTTLQKTLSGKKHKLILLRNVFPTHFCMHFLK